MCSLFYHDTQGTSVYSRSWLSRVASLVIVWTLSVAATLGAEWVCCTAEGIICGDQATESCKIRNNVKVAFLSHFPSRLR